MFIFTMRWRRFQTRWRRLRRSGGALAGTAGCCCASSLACAVAGTAGSCCATSLPFAQGDASAGTAGPCCASSLPVAQGGALALILAFFLGRESFATTSLLACFLALAGGVSPSATSHPRTFPGFGGTDNCDNKAATLGWIFMAADQKPERTRGISGTNSNGRACDMQNAMSSMVWQVHLTRNESKAAYGVYADISSNDSTWRRGVGRRQRVLQHNVHNADGPNHHEVVFGQSVPDAAQRAIARSTHPQIVTSMTHETYDYSMTIV